MKLLAEQKLPVVADFVSIPPLLLFCVPGVCVCCKFIVFFFARFLLQIEQYAPGLPKKIGDASCAFCDTVSTFASNAYKHTFEFFKTQVFV